MKINETYIEDKPQEEPPAWAQELIGIFNNLLQQLFDELNKTPYPNKLKEQIFQVYMTGLSNGALTMLEVLNKHKPAYPIIGRLAPQKGHKSC